MKTLYFAGKIGKQDWRTELFGARAGGCQAEDAFDPHYTITEEDFIYDGPFFVACDHGCGHGAAAHGVGIGMIYDYDDHGEIIEGTGVEGAAGCFGGDVPHGDGIRKAVFSLCRLRIRKADHVFAFINETDCFGTIAEIGIANEMKKPITIALGPKITPEIEKELWFVLHCASAGLYRGPIKQVWARFRSERLRIEALAQR